MAGHTPWREVKARRGADTPERQEMRAAYRRAMEDALKLARLREFRGVTQVEMGGVLGVSQANVSQLERREDLYLSTLRGYVAALGGELKLLAVFPDETVELAIADTDETTLAAKAGAMKALAAEPTHD